MWAFCCLKFVQLTRRQLYSAKPICVKCKFKGLTLTLTLTLTLSWAASRQVPNGDLRGQLSVI